MNLKLGSLFDGSGGFPLAGTLCGITPVWASEIEPYPIAVTKSRFPNMKHLGDISNINGAEIEPVDIITFGSPCQDLSVAGKRAGLKHESNGDEETTRSGLFMEAVRIIKQMREATDGKYPTFALWENVPGAFSSNKGEDFRVVCEELIKIVEPSATMPEVPKNGWPYADSYIGNGWSLAYRVFDAQYWGVPQRRRRIYLVLDLRGERAREILFEREGLRGYFAEGRTPWKAVTGNAQDCAGTDDSEGAIYAVDQGGGKSGANYHDNLSPTLTCTHGGEPAVAYGICSYASNSMKSPNPHSGIYEAETSRTLDLNGGNPACNQGGIVIVSPTVAIEGNGQRESHSGNGYIESDTMYTLNTIERHAVAYIEPVPYTLKIRSGCEGGGKGALVQTDKSATLATNNDQYLFQPVVGEAAGFCPEQSAKTRGIGYEEEMSPTLRAGVTPAVAYLASGKDAVGTLMANAGTKLWLGNQEAFSGDYHIIEKREVPSVRYIVRRLTPTECARLQGFADRWGDIDTKEDFTDSEYHFWLEVRNTHAAIMGKTVKDYTKPQMLTWYNKLSTDSAEYKLWGNGIALPTALYCMQGIADVMSYES